MFLTNVNWISRHPLLALWLPLSALKPPKKAFRKLARVIVGHLCCGHGVLASRAPSGGLGRHGLGPATRARAVDGVPEVGCRDEL